MQKPDLPPESQSFYSVVTKSWIKTQSAIMDGFPIDSSIYDIETAIAKRKRQIDAGDLNEEFD